MRSVHESNVTAGPAAESSDSRAAGVWTLAGSELIIAEPGGPATILIPTEAVTLMLVDLPVSGRARRIAALPFAVEDRIAEPVESVHLALGSEIAPRQFLVGVVAHDRMAEWMDHAEAAGLGHAAMVPDALALPQPAEGAWSVDLDGNRAVVRSGDGTGFAVPAAMLKPAWEAAGRPPATAYGAPLPADMMLSRGSVEAGSLAMRLAAPPLDLRQGIYARTRRTSNAWRKFAWIVALGAAAHAVIALADTVMLRTIADRREAETRALVASMAPGMEGQEDLPGTLANMLPRGGSASVGAPQIFLPLANRVFGAMAPMGGGIQVRAMDFKANTLTLDIASAPGLAGRLRAAFASAQLKAQVAESSDGMIRITASAA